VARPTTSFFIDEPEAEGLLDVRRCYDRCAFVTHIVDWMVARRDTLLM
jgi:hypothetical protein